MSPAAAASCLRLLNGERTEQRQAEETARRPEERPPSLTERRTVEERSHGSAPGAEPQSDPGRLLTTTPHLTTRSAEPDEAGNIQSEFYRACGFGF